MNRYNGWTKQQLVLLALSSIALLLNTKKNSEAKVQEWNYHYFHDLPSLSLACYSYFTIIEILQTLTGYSKDDYAAESHISYNYRMHHTLNLANLSMTQYIVLKLFDINYFICSINSGHK